MEFVSANPTGPLHIGHGRGAALGDALANLLAATGHTVEREYYINDVGNQILTLGKSLYFRLRELAGEVVEFPEDGYQGDYMKDLARDYLAQGQPRRAGPEPHDDDLVRLGRYAGDVILDDIKQDLEDFGVRFDHWFSETELYRQGLVDQGFDLLKELGYLYEAGRRPVVQGHRLRGRKRPGGAAQQRGHHLLRLGRGLSPAQIPAGL